MRLRAQLLLVSLLTLALPWAGLGYVREMESALRRSQQDTLLESAGAIAGSLADRPQLLYRHPELRNARAAGPGDLYAHRLPETTALDGFPSEWNLGEEAYVALTPSHATLRASLLAGVSGGDVHLLIRVEDDEVVYRSPGASAYDGVLLTIGDGAGGRRRYALDTAGPGRLVARRLDGATAAGEVRIQGEWEATGRGYNLELRLREEVVGPRLAVTVVDADADAAAPRRASTAPDGRPGLLIYAPAALQAALDARGRDDRRLRVTDAAGWLLGTSGRLRAAPGDAGGSDAPPRQELLRRLLDPTAGTAPPLRSEPGRLVGPELDAALAGEPLARWYVVPGTERALVSAAVPIRGDDGVLGAVVLQQSSEAILTFTNRALTRLMTLTLLAALAAAAGLLGYATLLSLRIRRLSRAAERAIGPRGDIRGHIPGTGAGDEIGELSRSFAGLLARLREYTDYLRSLAGKLSHELRTPLAVVQSSLDNLDAVELDEQARVYAGRAREGTARLRALVTAMTEASRIEESIRSADPESFDVASLVAGSVAGYRDVNGTKRFRTEVPAGPVLLRGVPELVAQLLDKLVDNAVDFTPDGGLIEVGLQTIADGCLISVSNDGPPLPAQMQDRLFDSLVSLRDGRAGAGPHLGFGLYVARLIAEFHGGSIEARNLESDRGVRFTVTLRSQAPPLAA